MPCTCFNALTIWVIFLLCFIGCTSNEAPQVETKDNTIKPDDSGPVVYEEFDDLSACGHAQAGGWPPYEESESTLH